LVVAVARYLLRASSNERPAPKMRTPANVEIKEAPVQLTGELHRMKGDQKCGRCYERKADNLLFIMIKGFSVLLPNIGFAC
jgi:hypothetical protein